MRNQSGPRSDNQRAWRAAPACLSTLRKHFLPEWRLPHLRIDVDMEIYQLRSFIAVAKMGHLTRAAEKLHLSQPSVSAHIKALEDEFGLSLFERTYSGMTLTLPGKRLLTEAEGILVAAEAMRHTAKALKGEITGRVRVGTSSDPGFIRIGEFCNAQMEHHPSLEVELHQEMAAGIPAAKLVVIEHCGHMSALEQPQQVNAALQNWLSALPE